MMNNRASIRVITDCATRGFFNIMVKLSGVGKVVQVTIMEDTALEMTSMISEDVATRFEKSIEVEGVVLVVVVVEADLFKEDMLMRNVVEGLILWLNA